jgi:hypothetical protein
LRGWAASISETTSSIDQSRSGTGRRDESEKIGMLEFFAWVSFAAMIAIPSYCVWRIAMRKTSASRSEIYFLGLLCLVLFGVWGFVHELDLEHHKLQTEQGGMRYAENVLAYIAVLISYLAIGILLAVVSSIASRVRR